jgi:hypothetical protein
MKFEVRFATSLMRKSMFHKKCHFSRGWAHAFFKPRRLESLTAFGFSELEDTRNNGACVDNVQKAK